MDVLPTPELLIEESAEAIPLDYTPIPGQPPTQEAPPAPIDKVDQGPGDGTEALDFTSNPDFAPMADSDVTQESASDLDFSKNPDFEPLESDTASSTTNAVVQGAVKGVTEGTSLSAGLLSGARLGFLATAAIPVPGARIVGTTVGTLIGGGLSMYAAHTAVNALGKLKLPSGAPLTYSNLDDVPKKDRVAFAFGETAGNGASFVGGTVALAKSGVKVLSPSYVGKVANGILESAARTTKTFVAKELIAVAGAAAGGAAAEALDSGDKLTRFGAEVVGGVVAPGKLVISAAVFTKGQVVKWAKVLSPAAQRSEAARIIQSAFKTSGDDIVLTSKLLDAALEGGPQTPATVAQTVANDATIALETAVRKFTKSADVEINDAAEATYSVLRKSVALLRGTGDPSALREAATLESRYFLTLLTERANAAKQVASDAASKLPLTNVNRAALSTQAFEAADTALKQAREAETTFWAAVPTDIPAEATNILQGFADIRASMLARTPVPPLVQKTLNDIADGTQAVTTGFLKKFRSEMLSEARAATNLADNASDVRFYGHLAEAALDDMDTVFKGPNADGLGAAGFSTEAYDNARRFTSSLHDAFTNSYTGKALAAGRTGLKQAPEVLLGRAFVGGREVTAHRLGELEESVRFLPDMNLGGQEALDNVGLMIQAQERFFSILATDTPGTGLEKVKFIQNFLKKNPELAVRFPNQTKFLNSIADTEEAAVTAINRLAQGTEAIEKRAAFSRFTSGAKNRNPESPVDSMRSVFLSKSPSRELTSLAKLSSKKGGEVMQGFKATVYDHAVREATRGDGSTDFVKLRQVLFDPISPGQPSAIDIMVKNGGMPKSEVTQIKAVLNASDNVLKSQSRGVQATEIDELSGGLSQLVIRAHGAKAAGAALGGGNGAQLIIAAGGAKLSEQIIAKTPNAKVAKLVSEAMVNKELFLALSAKAVSDVEKFSAAMALNSILVRLGMRPVTPLGTATLNAVDVESEDLAEGPQEQPVGTSANILQ